VNPLQVFDSLGREVRLDRPDRLAAAAGESQATARVASNGIVHVSHDVPNDIVVIAIDFDVADRADPRLPREERHGSTVGENEELVGLASACIMP
jgi:hypothetical protein